MQPSSNNNSSILLWAILLQIVAIILFLFWAFVAIFSPMFADGGVNNGIYALILFCRTMPFLMILLSIPIWIGYKRRNSKLLFMVSGFQLASVIPLFIIG